MTRPVFRTFTPHRLRCFQLDLVNQGTTSITINGPIGGLHFLFDVTLNNPVVEHTDAAGSYSYNQTLSDNWAETVANELEEHIEIGAQPLEPHSAGPLLPVYPNATNAAQGKNGRIEI